MSSKADEAKWRVRAPDFTPKWLSYVDRLAPTLYAAVRYVDVDASALLEDIDKWPKLQRQLSSHVDELVYVNALASPSSALVVALDMLQLRHEDSPVWWVSLDNGPQFAATLWDLVVGTVLDEKYRTIGVCPGALSSSTPIWDRYHLTPEHDRVYLMSLDQFDKAEWPAESEDGPPYTPHVSVYR